MLELLSCFLRLGLHAPLSSLHCCLYHLSLILACEPHKWTHGRLLLTCESDLEGKRPIQEACAPSLHWTGRGECCWPPGADPHFLCSRLKRSALLRLCTMEGRGRGRGRGRGGATARGGARGGAVNRASTAPRPDGVPPPNLIASLGKSAEFEVLTATEAPKTFPVPPSPCCCPHSSPNPRLGLPAQDRATQPISDSTIRYNTSTFNSE